MVVVNYREEIRTTLGFHYCRVLLTQHYDQRPFDETVCDAGHIVLFN